MPGNGGGGGGKPGGGGGGDDGPLSLNGNRKDNVLIGGDFGDNIWGREGDDVLWGRGGDDLLVGGDGNDSLYGEDGDDRLHGSAGDDLLDGGEGSDWLQGNTGSDTLDGGVDEDGIEDHDIASFQEIAATSSDGGGLILTTYYDSFTDSSTYTVFNPATGDTDTVLRVEEVIGSNYNDAMTGGDGEDYFVGNRGEDVIDTGGGDDQVYGSLDDDTLTGGDGADTFIFLRYGTDGSTLTADPGLGDGVDLVTDFNPLEGDRILFLGNEDFLTNGNLVLSPDANGDIQVQYAADSWFVLQDVAVGTAITIAFELVDV